MKTPLAQTATFTNPARQETDEEGKGKGVWEEAKTAENKFKPVQHSQRRRRERKRKREREK